MRGRRKRAAYNELLLVVFVAAIELADGHFKYIPATVLSPCTLFRQGKGHRSRKSQKV